MQETSKVAESTATTTTTSVTTTVSALEDGDSPCLVKKDVCKETTTTSVETSTITYSSSDIKSVSTSSSAGNLDPPAASLLADQSNNNNNSGSSNDSHGASQLNSKGDEKQDQIEPTIMSVQTAFPNSKATILKMDGQSNGTSTPSTKTVLVVNREGGKVTLQVATKPITNASTIITQSNQTSTTTSGVMSGKDLCSVSHLF